MGMELEAAALRLFEQQGFSDVTVEQIASTAQISVRTFYRYFCTKEDVLQFRIDRQSAALRGALAKRPDDEPPLRALRQALEELVRAEDTDLLRQWIAVVAATPCVLKSVFGGILLKSHQLMAEFFAARLGLPNDDIVPTMLASASGGVIQAAYTQWFFRGGDLAARVSESLAVLENGIGANPESWRVQRASGGAPAERR